MCKRNSMGCRLATHCCKITELALEGRDVSQGLEPLVVLVLETTGTILAVGHAEGMDMPNPREVCQTGLLSR